MKKSCLFSAFAIVVFGAVQAQAITITSNKVVADVVKKASVGYEGDRVESNDTTFPASPLLEASLSGGFSSTLQVSYSGVGDRVTLENTFTQMRRGDYFGEYSQVFGYVDFLVDGNTFYDASGVYEAAHASDPGWVLMESRLTDDLGHVLFDSYQYSLNTVNESFTLGGAGGDTSNTQIGSLSGDLVTGTAYTWSWSASIYTNPGPDGGASASGNISLKIGGGAPSAGVPDTGATVSLLGVALAGLAFARRRLM